MDYAFQSFDALPDWFTVPEGRAKPYGTVPAVLSGKDVITGKFAVVNADDYYGPGAFTLMYEALEKLPETPRPAVASLKPRQHRERASATRGVCRIDGGEMTAVKETFKIGKAPDGSIRSFADSEEGVALDGESPVSMNFWGFTPWALGTMETISIRSSALRRQRAQERVCRRRWSATCPRRVYVDAYTTEKHDVPTRTAPRPPPCSASSPPRVCTPETLY